MQIFVDADAFPGVLKDILFRAVDRVRVPLILVANTFVRVPRAENVSSVMVPGGADAADDRIVELVQPGDLVITADIPLADRVIEKGATAIDPRGTLYTATNIKQRLATRDLMDELRGAGLVSGGPGGLDHRNVQAFADQLDRFLTKFRACEGRGDV